MDGSWTRRRVVTTRVEYVLDTSPGSGAMANTLGVLLSALHFELGDRVKFNDAYRITSNENEVIFAFEVETVTEEEPGEEDRALRLGDPVDVHLPGFGWFSAHVHLGGPVARQPGGQRTGLCVLPDHEEKDRLTQWPRHVLREGAQVEVIGVMQEVLPGVVSRPGNTDRLVVNVVSDDAEDAVADAPPSLLILREGDTLPVFVDPARDPGGAVTRQAVVRKRTDGSLFAEFEWPD